MISNYLKHYKYAVRISEKIPVTFELKKDIRNKKLFVYKDFGFIVLSSRLFIINITLESETPAYYQKPEDNLMTRGAS